MSVQTLSMFELGQRFKLSHFAAKIEHWPKIDQCSIVGQFWPIYNLSWRLSPNYVAPISSPNYSPFNFGEIEMDPIDQNTRFFGNRFFSSTIPESTYLFQCTKKLAPNIELNVKLSGASFVLSHTAPKCSIGGTRSRDLQTLALIEKSIVGVLFRGERL